MQNTRRMQGGTQDSGNRIRRICERQKTRGRMGVEEGPEQDGGKEGVGEEKMTGRQWDRKDQKREDP